MKVLEAIFRLKDEFTAPLRGAETGLRGFTLSVGSLVKGLAALGLGAALGKFFKDSISEAFAAEQALGFLRQAVNNAGQSFSDWQPEIDQSIDKLTKLTKYGDDDFRAALTNMVAKTGDVKGSLGNMSLAADIAAKKNIGLAEAGDLVGKAMTGNEKVFKDFGIVAGTNAEKMEQLRERTRGYAETELGTLGGRLAQAKANFGELQEQVGNMIVGSDGAREMAGRLSTAMADLATWISENREAGLKFVDTVFSMIRAVGEMLAPVWSLIVAMKDGIEATIGWGNIWRGFQVAVTAVAGTFGVLASAGKQAVGEILDALGWLLSKAAPVLDFLGMSVGNTADALIATGKRMKTEATKAASETIDAMTGKIAMIVTQTEVGQKKQTQAYKDGATARTNVVDAEHKAHEAAERKSAANLATLKRDAFKASLQLLNAQEREYQEVVRKYQDLMQDMTAAHYAEAQTLLKKQLDDMLLRWTGMGTTIVARTQQNGMVLRSELATWPASLIAMRTESELTLIQWDRMLDKAAEMGQGVAGAANQLLNFADAIGVSDEHMMKLVEGVSQLGSAIGMIASGDVLGGLAAGVQGIQSVIGGLFGQSAEEKRLAEELAKTRRAIDRLRDSIGDLMNMSTPGGKIAKFKQVEYSQLNSIDGEHWTDQQARNVAFRQLLAKQGLTFGEADQLMKDMTGQGISMTDKGGLTAAAVQAFIDAMNASEFGQFAQTFESQMEVSESIRNASGDTSTATAVRDLITNLRGEGGSTQLADFLSQFMDAEGNINADAARAGAAELLRTLNAGGFNEANFGGLTGGQYVDAINTFIGYLGSSGSAGTAGTGIVPVPSIPTTNFGTASTAVIDVGSSLLEKFDVANSHLGDLVTLSRRIAAATETTAAATDDTSDQLAALRLERGLQGGSSPDQMDVALQALADLTAANTGST